MTMLVGGISFFFLSFFLEVVVGGGQWVKYWSNMGCATAKFEKWVTVCPAFRRSGVKKDKRKTVDEMR